MTNEEFIAKLTRKCDISDLPAWLEWEWTHPQWKELSNEPQFRDWFNRAFDANGISHTDEHYGYHGETEIDRELGGRLSWFDTWECFGVVEHLTLSDEDADFPLYAHAFSYGKEKYWVITMVGQGSISWLMTDEAFRKEYITKENNKMKYPIKFTDNNADTLLLDNIFAVDECLEYALKHNVDVMFTETTFTSAVESIYKFCVHGYKPIFKEVKQIAPDGLVLSPKIHVLLRRDEPIKEDSN